MTDSPRSLSVNRIPFWCSKNCFWSYTKSRFCRPTICHQKKSRESLWRQKDWNLEKSLCSSEKNPTFKSQKPLWKRNGRRYSPLAWTQKKYPSRRTLRARMGYLCFFFLKKKLFLFFHFLKLTYTLYFFGKEKTYHRTNYNHHSKFNHFFLRWIRNGHDNISDDKKIKGKEYIDSNFIANILHFFCEIFFRETLKFDKYIFIERFYTPIDKDKYAKNFDISWNWKENWMNYIHRIRVISPIVAHFL